MNPNRVTETKIYVHVNTVNNVDVQSEKRHYSSVLLIPTDQRYFKVPCFPIP